MQACRQASWQQAAKQANFKLAGQYTPSVSYSNHSASSCVSLLDTDSCKTKYRDRHMV